jgi:hypothetical protein
MGRACRYGARWTSAHFLLQSQSTSGNNVRMETYFNTVFAFVCLVVLIQFFEPWVLQLFSTRLTLTDDELGEVVGTANSIPHRKRGWIHAAGALTAIAIMLPIVLGLVFPLFMPSGTFYQHWSDFVLQLPTWIWLLGLLPGILLAGLVGNYIATKLARLVAMPFMSTRSSRFLEFMGSGSYDADGNYRPYRDIRSVHRYTMFAMLGLYLITVALIYMTADVLTTTHYHQRSIIPWLNQQVPHEQLIYTVDEDSGQLEITFADNRSVLKSVFLLGNSELTMQQTLADIDDKTTATLIRR